MTTARWRTLSSKVGIPIGRVSVLEPPLGICTRRTGGARYVPDFTRSSRPWRLPSRFCSYSSAVTPSTPAAPSLRVRRYASLSQSMSIRWASEVNAINGDCFASAAIRSCFVDTLVEFRSIRRVSQERFLDPTPRFPPLAPGGTRSPASPVLSRRYDFLPPIPPHFVAFVWRYLSVHSFFSLSGGRVRRRSLELVTRYLRPGLR